MARCRSASDLPVPRAMENTACCVTPTSTFITESSASRAVGPRSACREVDEDEARPTVQHRAKPHPAPALARRTDDRTGMLAKLPSERDMARGLRRWLKRAKVDRTELHTTTATTKAMTWHDLRATGLTWMAVGRRRAQDHATARSRAFETTEKYVREAEAIREGFGEVFPPLPELLSPGTRPSDWAKLRETDPNS